MWTIRETNGRAVTITSFRYVVRTVDGREESNEEIVQSISFDFTGTSAPTLRVLAELTTNGLPAFPGGTAVFTASGTDDTGAAVSSTASLSLLPPP